ncbi:MULTISPECIES: tRNA pseudouridine(38-40) synthase TruA [Loigolactobacillus]|uniref:tRNA pseudouridine(38-40) synthase TruA n=1 Tax=Loigolactobacillus TaxID=2767889 RepID=UPI000C1CA48E|nr:MULTISPECIES: tRNA pseudouridine(38-40) synthase TruA [Loigolactobacillus]MDA5387549.1 tRNA pseudouridine(38-40) synthase TruA [Loigolactobacillus backii]MDA5390087.1 tRNA pseudouridine(38-40) synthase TruA [Loigolactobacillus backii]
MVRYKVTLAYDGTQFAGFQLQPNQRTVQGVIEKALMIMAKSSRIPVSGSGRTDSGVHALGQVIHFDFPFLLPAEKMLKALNSLLPLDVKVVACEIAESNFHARYNTTGKKYRYRVNLDYYTNPFTRFYTGHWKYSLDVKKVQIAVKDYIGTHDFTSFAASGGSIKNKVRTIYASTVHFDQPNNELIFEFYGDGFLYNMVRIMVGVLLEIGNGRRALHDIPRLYAVKDRRQARLTAAASGLYLEKVYYGDGPADQIK